MAKKPDVTLFALFKKGKIQNKFDADLFMKYVDKKKDMAREIYGTLYVCIYIGNSKNLMAKVCCNDDFLPAGDETIEFYRYDRDNYIWQQMRYDDFMKDVFETLDKDREENKKRDIRRKIMEMEMRNKKYEEKR